MNDSMPPEPDPHDSSAEPPEGGGRTEQVQSTPVTARVPDHVSQGVFSTGVIIMTGNTEFVLDFLQCIGKPRQVAARVVMPHATLPQMIDALTRNIELYKQRFGDLHEPARPPQQNSPSVQDIYDELKLPDAVLSGAYANGVMITHGPTEFGFDFLTNFFPHSAVSCRVFLAAGQAPRLLESLQGTFQQFQTRVQEQQKAQAEKREQEDETPPTAGPNGNE